MKIESTLGDSSIYTLYADQEFVEKMFAMGFPKQEGAPACRVRILNGGLVLLGLPNSHKDGVIRRLCPHKTLGPDGRPQYWSFNTGYLNKVQGIDLATLGDPWRKGEASTTEWDLDNQEIRIYPPEHRAPPRRFRSVMDKIVEEQSEPQGLLFLGTFPDGSPVSFSLPMGRTMELMEWLRERDIDVSYEAP